MFNAQWARLDFNAIGPAGKEPGPARSEDSDSEFIPLVRGSGGAATAKEAVTNMVRQAEEKAARIEQEAYAKGFAQGEKDGLELGRKKAEKIAENMERLLQELRGLKGALAKSHEKEILAIVCAIAKRIIRSEALQDEHLVQRTVQNALRLAADRSELSIKVNPEDVRIIEAVKPGFFAEFKDLKGLAVTPDASISRGGCLMECPCGSVDGRIEMQMEEIYEVVDEALHHKNS